MGTENPVKIATEAIKLAKDNGYDYVFLDTAGRLHIDEQLMQELKDIKSSVKPHEILLVIDSMLGQDAVTVASSFNDALGIDGLVLTKLDGDTRGGAALSAKSVTGKPIKFMGMGEKLDALEPFHPERMASRILGMGDVLSLIEKAQENFDEKKAAELERKMKKNEFTLEDFLDQFSQVRNMGGFGKMMEMLPGVSGKVSEDQLSDGEKEMKYMEAIIFSMTPAERRDPSILNASRRKRIAAGAGVTVTRVNQLIKRYEETKKMMKMLNGGKMKKNRLFRGLF
jgi:signal recognition particle subunit SRP54